MKTSIKNALIKELNEKINEYVDKKGLFAGGCCFSAYVLTEYLRKCGIEYKVAIFQYLDILNEKNFTNAINGNGVCHVAVEVVYKRKRMFIGKCDGIYHYFKMSEEKYHLRRYKNVEPIDLLSAYIGNEWNWVYDTANNVPLINDIKKIAMKYLDEIA